jgi:hypothetical protein
LGPVGAGGAQGSSGAGGPGVTTVFNSVPEDFVPPKNPATEWTNMSDWFNNPTTNSLLNKFGLVVPEVGFWPSFLMQGKSGLSMWGKLFSDPLTFGKDWAGVIGGLSGFRDLAAVMAAVGSKISPLWYVWGGLNGAWAIGGGLIYQGGRLTGWIPDVNPPGVVQQ